MHASPLALHPPRPPHTRALRIAMFVAMGIGTVASWVATMLTPVLATRHPLLLLVLDAPGRNILLAHGLPLGMSVAVATVRRVGGASLFFFAGRWYGDAALAKIGWHAKPQSRVRRFLQRVVRAALVPLVALMPDAPVSTLAGASRMRPVSYITLSTIGSIVATIALRRLGTAATAPLHALLAFFARHALASTAIIATALLALTSRRVLRKRPRPIVASEPTAALAAS